MLELLKKVAEEGPQFSQRTYDIIIAASILAGLMNCFFGYHIFKVILGISGFFFGAFAGGWIALALGGKTVVVLAISIPVGGVIGAFLMIPLYLAAVFVLGALLGGLFASMACSAAGSAPPPVILGIAGVICGIVALVLQKLIIILATSFGGSLGVVTGIFYFLDKGFNPVTLFQDPKQLESFVEEHIALVVCWFVLGLVGVAVQYCLTARKKKVEAEEEPEGSSG